MKLHQSKQNHECYRDACVLNHLIAQGKVQRTLFSHNYVCITKHFFFIKKYLDLFCIFVS